MTQKLHFLLFVLAMFATGLAINVNAQITPEIYSWQFWDGTTTGKYYTSAATIIDTGVPTDVQEVWYTTDSVYIKATGVPAYLTGPFLDGNPGVPDDQDFLFRIPRTPQPETGTETTVPLGAIGALINGVLFENYADAMSYNNQGVWNQNANFFEGDGFDCARGHPQGSAYHHHQNPVPYSLQTAPLYNYCDTYPSEGLYVPDATQHSPLIGFAFDGYPLYGPYGYANTDGTGGIVKMESSYALRNITARTHLADGTDVTDGPPINATYPLGAYKEDYEYNAGSGDLDDHNGRWCITPEYPQGTYAYFTTEDTDGYSAYPFFIGPTYYGVVDQANINTGGPGGGPPGGPGNPPPCNQVPPGMPCCGDGICGGPETADNCPEDCGDGGGGGDPVGAIAIPTNATQYFGKSSLAVKMILQGAYDEDIQAMYTMLLDDNLLPLSQPYNIAPWNHMENLMLNSVSDFPVNTVDWVLVELRSGTPQVAGSGPATTLVEARAGLLLSDGNVVNADGNPLEFDNITDGTAYHVLVRHRNHLAVCSSTPIVGSFSMTYDFTTSTIQALGTAQQIANDSGQGMLHTGDMNPDGIIQSTDYDTWRTSPAVLNTYNIRDANLDGTVQITDYDKWFRNRAINGIAEVR